MTSLGLTPLLSLLFLLMVSGGVVSQRWAVFYTPRSICAGKGSTVTLGCRYTYPTSRNRSKVEKTFWSRERVQRRKEPPDLSSDPEYRDRVQYLGDTLSDCSLRLSDVREQDRGTYYFTFITDGYRGIFQGVPGVFLSVRASELQVEMSPDEVVEGKTVTLTCKITCSPTVSWYKSGNLLSSSSNPLRLQPVSQRDSGDYSCAAQGEDYRSPAVTLDVQYPPKSVSVSISPSGETVEGSSVTLTCSSDANPPVETYSWYKVNESSPVGSGQSYSFTLSFSSSGWFYCVAQNKYGNQRAAAVPLTVNGGRSVVLYVVLGVTVGFGCLCAVIGVLFMWRKRRRGSADDAMSSQNVHFSPTDDTYTALDPQTRSYNDTYDTLATVHPSPPDDTPAARDSQSISPDYNNLPASRKRQ
ncbi:B-cell receptor CD22-like [Neoarius graeffei]|uniref:B-cell receptor CD22-like n=1 Tax=Neoarius graeffei TaxID=443677 RepID=UPI00298C80DE|nr:B-cell receptor CD22-like [Neoarius graeffei]